MQNTRSAFAVPSPSSSFPSLAVRLLQATGSWQGPGKEASSAWCERLPESFSTVVFYKSTALLYGRQQNGQQDADKSKEMRRCQRVVAIL